MLGVMAASLLLHGCTAPATSPRTEPEPTPEPNAESTPKPNAEPTPSPPPPSGYAVVGVGQRLFTSSTGGTGVKLPALGTGPSAPVGMTVDVIGEYDGRILFETLGTPPTKGHCAGSLEVLEDFRLRLHVAPEALLPVVTEEFTHAFEDGTSVRLMPGAVLPSPDATEVIAAGTRVRVTVPPQMRGPHYQPRPLLSNEGSEGHVYEWDGRTLLYDGGHPLDDEALFGLGNALMHFGSTDRGSSTLVTLRNPCMEIQAIAASEHLRPSPASPVIVGMLDSEQSDSSAAASASWSVHPPTSIFWPNGRLAGEVITDHVFTAEPRTRDERTCFDVPLTQRPAPALTLCFAPDDVSMKGEIAAPSGPSRRPPTIRKSKPSVKGALDAATITSVIRANLHPVASCYDGGLATDPSLAGTVTVQFAIGPTGYVSVAALAASTLEDEEVRACILEVVERWEFPKPPGGGNTIVTHPFVLTPP